MASRSGSTRTGTESGTEIYDNQFYGLKELPPRHAQVAAAVVGVGGARGPGTRETLLNGLLLSGFVI